MKRMERTNSLLVLLTLVVNMAASATFYSTMHGVLITDAEKCVYDGSLSIADGEIVIQLDPVICPRKEPINQTFSCVDFDIQQVGTCSGNLYVSFLSKPAWPLKRMVAMSVDKKNRVVNFVSETDVSMLLLTL